MYKLILDSDALIKLTHADILAILCKQYTCIITPEVKRETVDAGKERLYQDAEKIEDMINKNMLQIQQPHQEISVSRNLGRGELSVLQLSKEIKNTLVVTDDKTFIRELQQQQIPFLIPIDIIALLVHQKKIQKLEALNALENIRPFIDEKEYVYLKNLMEEKAL